MRYGTQKKKLQSMHLKNTSREATPTNEEHDNRHLHCIISDHDVTGAEPATSAIRNPQRTAVFSGSRSDLHLHRYSHRSGATASISDWADAGNTDCNGPDADGDLPKCANDHS